jgi:hypothetical protein
LKQEHNNQPQAKKVIDARIERADLMIAVLNENPIPDSHRADFWKLTTLIGDRKVEEKNVLDALCCLMHKAIRLGLEPSATTSAMFTHIEKETGRKISRPMQNNDKPLDLAGDRLIIHCLETSRFWSEAYGWVDDLQNATTYDPGSEIDIQLPGGNCDVAQISQIRDVSTKL